MYPTTTAEGSVFSKTLQTFELNELAQFTQEGEFGPTASPEFRVFYVGRDDVHGILRYLLSRVSLALKLNMFGYDDEELNALIMALVKNPSVLVQGTLDRSQASGVHERKILAANEVADPDFPSYFVVGQSETHQISHTKGGVLDNIIGFEGSTNWSASGEGTGIALGGKAQPPGFKAQNNTLTVYNNAYEVAKFAARLDYEHAVAVQQVAARAAKAQQ